MTAAADERGDKAPVPSKPSLSLRAQVAILLAIATLPVGILAVAQGLVAYKDTQTLKYRSLAGAAISATQSERGAILEAFGAIASIDGMIDFDAPRGDCNDVLRTYVETVKTVSFAGVLRADGRLHCGHPFAADFDASASAEFAKFMAEPRRTVTAYARGSISKQAVLTASAPAYRDGRLVGSIAVSLPSQYLTWGLGREGLNPHARFALVTGDGVRVSGGDVSAKMEWLPGPDAMAHLLSANRAPVLMRPARGERRVYSATPLFERDVFAIASWPEDRLLQSLGWRQLLTVALPIVMWVLAVCVAYYAVDRFALRHVLYLDRLVTAYGRSRRKLRARGVRDAPQEFAQLGASFDQMAEEIESRETALRESLEEKKTLLKEVYHRVKNNLQLVISLVNLQMRDAKDERERDGLRRLQDRVHGLSTVHQKLYEAEMLNAVPIDALLRDIARNAKGARGPDACDVDLRFDLESLIEGPDRALPIALFATEAIANAFKHALAFGTRGWLSISLRSSGDTFILEVANDVPDPKPAGESPKPGLGTQLIEGFARQLRGTVERECRPDRYAVRLIFPRADEAPGDA